MVVIEAATVTPASSSPANATPRYSGTFLAFDFGTRRIGVAVGESPLRIAHPLTTILGERNDQRFAAIAKLIEEWEPACLVVGLPLTTDGEEHEMTRRCRRFANQLSGRFGRPVRLVDERFSSTTAEAQLRDGGWRGDKSQIDAASAQVILQAYFASFADNHDESDA